MTAVGFRASAGPGLGLKTRLLSRTMDPTALPTDNLYKFMALGGLALVGFCIWMRLKITDTLGKVVSDVEGSMLKTKSLMAPIEATTKSFFDRVASGQEEAGDEGYWSSEAFRNVQQHMKESEPALAQQMASIRGAFADTEQLYVTVRGLFDRSKQTLEQLKLFSYLGAIVMGIGFGLWYAKLQRYQDQTTILQRDKAQLELEAAKAGLEDAKAKTGENAAPPGAH
jgi:hypothetical protein